MELTRRGNNTKRGRIRATQSIGEGVIGIWVRRTHGTPDVFTGAGIFCHRTCCPVAFGETWGAVFVYICDVDRDINRVCELAIRNRDSHRIGGLGFIVQRSTGAELTVGAVNTERCSIGATQRVGQGVVVGVGCSDSTPDVLTRTGIFCHRPRRACSISEGRGAILVYIRDVDRDINRVCEFGIRDGNPH